MKNYFIIIGFLLNSLLGFPQSDKTGLLEPNSNSFITFDYPSKIIFHQSSAKDYGLILFDIDSCLFFNSNTIFQIYSDFYKNFYKELEKIDYEILLSAVEQDSIIIISRPVIKSESPINCNIKIDSLGILHFNCIDLYDTPRNQSEPVKTYRCVSFIFKKLDNFTDINAVKIDDTIIKIKK
jgi:hypothetical protein